MDKQQRLAAFRELSRACYSLWDWEMDEDCQVLETDCPHVSLYQKLMLNGGARRILESHRSDSSAPLILTVQSLLSWVFVFGEEQDTHLYVKGPFFSLRNDASRYDSILTDSRISQRTRSILSNSLRTLPTLPTQTAVDIARTLHYCVNGKQLPSAEVSTYVSQPKRKREPESAADPFERSSRLWQIEQEYVDKVRRGDLSISESFLGLTDRDAGVDYINRTEDLHKYRQGMHHLLTIVSRAAVDGGLPKKTSFSLCTKYRQILDNCASAEEMQVLSGEILSNYARHVHRVRQLSDCSARIKLCCVYIDTHPEEKLMLSTLAEKAGYTESYLSRKFNQEMGCTITAYIQQAKIERGKFLLVSSEHTVDEISDILGFGSRSYFSSVFRSLLGETPTQYRKRHKIM